MNAKENALRIIRCDRPERVVGGCPAHGIGYWGCNHEGYEGGGHHLPVGATWQDIWGTEWHREHDGVMGFPRGNPLADLPAVLPSYRWPDPDDERIVRQIDEQASGWNPAETFLCGSHRDTLWERCYMLVGMENAMCLFHDQPEVMRDVLRRIMDFHLGIAKHYLRAGVEMVTMSDDLGTQSGLLLSPEMIHEFLVPEYRRLFALYKSRQVLVNFHSCGHIEPVLDVFMDLGVDILNPLQATANDLLAVRRKTAGRMALQGGIRSGLIAAGPVAAIRAEVRQRIQELGRDGGYFCGPDQGMPWAASHIQAVAEAIDEFGRYPISRWAHSPPPLQRG
jgi:uroporphyrinogen decarboxylase